MLFTRRFLKDILILFIFWLVWYALTHNSITHPKAPLIKESYSIQLIQHPLILGLAGHNYLVIRNNEGEIERELHGLPTDKETGKWKYIGTKNTDLLLVWEFMNSEEFSEQKFTGIALYKGSKEEVYRTWEKSYDCKEKINAMNMPYPAYGFMLRGETVNSNSVAYTLAQCMELDMKHLGLFTPGGTTNLLEKE